MSNVPLAFILASICLAYSSLCCWKNCIMFQSEKGVFHLFRSDEGVTLHDTLIMIVDAYPHLVEYMVRFKCCRASARDMFLVSHSLESTVSLQLNCVWLPSTVMRPINLLFIVLNFLGLKLVGEKSFVSTQNTEERCNLFS